MSSLPTTGHRWAIYCRISVDQGHRGDAGDSVSMETQEAGCRALIERLDPDARIVEPMVLREVWTGVELFQRPKLTLLREAIRRGEIDAVACYQPKRWTRDPHHGGYLQTELREYGVALRFAQDDPGDGDAGTRVGFVQHFTGAAEHRDILERTMRARVAMVHAGQAYTACRKPPYGLRWSFKAEVKRDGRQVMKRDKWEEHPAEAPVVQFMFAQALQGASYRALADQLTKRGTPAPFGSDYWHFSTVRLILINRVYTGKVASLRTYRDPDDTYIGQNGKSAGRKIKRRKLKAEQDWVAIPDGFAPVLIEPETFEAVQGVLASGYNRGGRKMRHPEITLMAGGRTSCGVCGGSMTTHYSGGLVRRQPPSLACRHKNHGKDTRPAIQCALLDDAVKQVAALILEHPEVIRQQADLHRQQDPTVADLEMVERALLDIERRVQSVLLATQQVTSPEAASMVALQLESLIDQRKRAQQERNEILQRRAGWEAVQGMLTSFATICDRVKERLNAFDHTAWQEAVDALGITARVWPEGHPSRYQIKVRLDELLTPSLLEKLAPILDGTEKKPDSHCSTVRMRLPAV